MASPRGDASLLASPVQWEAAGNKEECTLEACFSSGFLKQNDDKLTYDLTETGAGQSLFYICLGVLVLILGLLEYIYLVVQRDANAVALLLPYGLYVGINKCKYLTVAALLPVLILAYSVLKYVVYWAAATDASVDVNGTTVYLNFGKALDKGATVSILQSIVYMAIAFNGYIMNYWDSIHDFYTNLKLKQLLKEPSPVFRGLERVQKVEMKTVERLMVEAGSSRDIGLLAKWPPEKREALVEAIYADPGHLVALRG